MSADITTARALAHDHVGPCVEEHTKSCDMLTIEFGQLFKEVATLARDLATARSALEARDELLNRWLRLTWSTVGPNARYDDLTKLHDETVAALTPATGEPT